MRTFRSLATASVVAVGLQLVAGPLVAQDAMPSPPAGGGALPGLEDLRPLPAPRNSSPAAPGNPAAGLPAAKMPPPGGVAQPIPQTREELLAELLDLLAKSPNATDAAPIAEAVESLWLQSDSDTVSLLMGRAAKAIDDEDSDLALKFLDAVVEIAPDFAEGWNKRAYVYFLDNDYDNAMNDLRRTLALEPKHFKALEGLARIMNETGQKKAALQAYREVLKINPNYDKARKMVEDLSVEVEGRGI